MNIGDLVEIKSGGPLMTVIENVDNLIKCTWYSPQTGIFYELVVPKEALRKGKKNTGV